MAERKLVVDFIEGVLRDQKVADAVADRNKDNAEEAPLLPQNRYQANEASLSNPVADDDVHVIPVDVRPENVAKPTTVLGAFFHMLKGNIGVGILAMPIAVSHAGLVLGTLGIPLLGALCIYCMQMLVKCNEILTRRQNVNNLDYAETAEAAFLNGPRMFRRYAHWAKNAVNAMLIVTQLGFCCAYFIVVAKSIFQVVESTTASEPIGVKGYVAILLPLIVLTCWIRNLNNISPVSYFAMGLQSIGIFMVFICLWKDIPPLEPLHLIGPLSTLPLYFGTVMFAFEGIGLVLVVKNDMAEEKRPLFGKFFGILNITMCLVVAMYTVMGFSGYAKYGDRVEDSITLSIDIPVVREVIQSFFAIAIFLTYALQFHVPIDIIWPAIEKKEFVQNLSNRWQRILEYLLRTVLVTFTCVLALAIPMLDLVISVVGSVFSSLLALIFPAILDIFTYWEAEDGSRMRLRKLLKNVPIALFGLVGAFIGGYTSIKEIVHCVRTDCEKH